MATDEEVANQKDLVNRLREEIAEGERARAERERAEANDITMTQLQAEEARLRARLAEQKAISAQVDGGSTPVSQALDDMARAVAAQKAQEELAENPSVEAPKENEVPPASPPKGTPPAPPVEATTSAKRGR